MTGPEHYQAAEKCVEDVQNMADADAIELVLMEAQVHATLALAAATALGQRQEPRAKDINAWEEVAGAWRP